MSEASVPSTARSGPADAGRSTSEAGVTARSGWWVLVLLCAAQFMVALDVTVVNVALPSIARGIAFRGGEAQWVVTAYLLCTGGLTLLGGRVADLLGRRRMLMVGLALFGGASLASGLATDAAFLIVARGAQGVGAALLSPAALSTITTVYSGPRRTAALSAWGAVGATGFAAGLLVGGMLTTWASWHWIFFINVPVAAAALVLVPLLTPARAREARPDGPLGLAGPVVLTGGLVALLYSITSGTDHGWGSGQTLASSAIAAALLSGFIRRERRTSAPLVPAAVWQNRPLVAGAAAMFGITGVIAGSLFVVTFFLQQQLHNSALHAGLDYLPFAVAIAVAAHIGPRLLTALGTRVVATAGLLTLGSGALMLAVAPNDAHYAPDLLPALIVLGVGAGLGFVSLSVTAMSEVAGDGTGAASGLLTTGHEVGGAVGVSLLSAVATSAGTGAVPIASGHHAALITAAAVATGLAALTMLALPSVRPPTGATTSLH